MNTLVKDLKLGYICFNKSNMPMKLLFVCLGNICRSPLAEGVMKHKIEELGYDFEVDSAGTSNWHVGEPPDSRGIIVASNHGIDISKQRARQFEINDFDSFDYIIAMDKSNYTNLLNLARHSNDSKKIKLYMNLAYTDNKMDVPDPYYDNRFEEVFELLNEATGKIINNLNKLSS